jgi:hypothetical protein
MIQKFTEDDDGSTAIEFDEEGIDYMVDGLMELSESPVGTVLSTPAVWTISAPWWKFWNRSPTPVVGVIRLRKVA